MKIAGHLTHQGIVDLETHRVVATFDRLLGKGSHVPDRTGGDVDSKGRFAFELPSADEIGPTVVFTVAGPSGSVVGSTTVARGNLADPVEIPIAVAAIDPIVPSTDPVLGARVFYSGRVIDTSGVGYPAGHQVLLWEQDGEILTPLSVAVTRSGGYFSGPWIPGTHVGIEATVSESDPIPIPLDLGAMPQTMLLVTEPPPVVDETEETAPCGSGIDDVPWNLEQGDLVSDPANFAQDPSRCATFTVPDRTIDEATFYAAVRTTQPDLKARTLDETPEIPQGLIDQLTKTILSKPTRRIGRPAPPPRGDDSINEPPPFDGPFEVPDVIGPIGGDPTGPVIARSIAPEPIDIGDDSVVVAARKRALRYAPGIELDRDWLSPGYLPTAESVLQDRIELGIPLELDHSVVTELIRDPKNVTPAGLLKAEHTSVVRRFRRAVRLLARPFISRFTLEPDTQIAWDEIPDGYQAVNTSHGHLLTFKQSWKAAGYSIGSPLYSLPLAPGQQKLISILDWNRTEVASRRSSRTTTEDLDTTLSHDRDINETISSVLSEEMTASSRARNAGVGGAVAGFVGPIVFGAVGGYSSAGSEATQSSTRQLSGETMNQLRDRTHQAASAVRTQRSSVVQVSSQSESVSAQTEIIANYNHCHSLTVHYFEVLRHVNVTLEVAAAQECLFVPLMMTEFDEKKALRWKDELRHGLRKPSLRSAFGSLERVSTDWQDASVPDGRHADSDVTELNGEFWLDIQLPRPADTSAGDYDSTAWNFYSAHFSDTQDIWERYMGTALEEDRDAIWDERLAPIVIQSMLDGLSLTVQLPYVPTSPTLLAVAIDTTMLGIYRPGTPLQVTFRAETPIPTMTRADITGVYLDLSTASLPPTGSIVLESGTIRYRTPYLSSVLFENRRIHNDISLLDDVFVSTPLSRIEKRNPREVDQRRADELLEHLNEHVEYYHRVVWMTMDANRRYMMLDGVIAPNAGGRSVASVVENRVMGIVGNSLILPVAPGVQLDPTYSYAEETPSDLLHLYAADPPPPQRLSFPTSGVFAEAVLGSCNTCEEIDDSRFWRFEDAPIPDSPTPIESLSFESRRTDPPSLAPDEFATPLVGYQTVPDAPDPTGMVAALETLGAADAFRDMTGLAGNQANSASALSAAIGAAQGFASKAGELAQQQYLTRELDSTLNLIESAHITDGEKQGFAEALFRGALGLARPGVPGTDTPGVKEALGQLLTEGVGSASQADSTGKQSITLGGGGASHEGE